MWSRLPRDRTRYNCKMEVFWKVPNFLRRATTNEHPLGRQSRKGDGVCHEAQKWNVVRRELLTNALLVSQFDVDILTPFL